MKRKTKAWDFMKKIMEMYFRCWLTKDGSNLADIFADDIVYSECYGPEYVGIQQVIKWFREWNLKGSVLQWDIKDVIEQDNKVMVEWYFKCEYEGSIDGFDGVTIAKFDNNRKIYELKEFQSKAEHYYPYSEMKML